MGDDWIYVGEEIPFLNGWRNAMNKPYLTKYWLGRWWWYRHTSKKHDLQVIGYGRFKIGRISYRRTR